MTEFIVHVENRPGTLATITELLGSSGVNIEALAAYGYDGEGVLRLIVDDAATTRRILAEAGFRVEEHTVLTAFMPHAPGALASVTRQLAEADVNIDALYVLSTSAEGIEVAIAVDDNASAVPDLPVTGSISR
ncbi:MAG TPA: ACT domain-containing protein [Acidimicrobiia bacterium]|nr:ACT domain-containing protein [Acidimicrobiia bacterium]